MGRMGRQGRHTHKLFQQLHFKRAGTRQLHPIVMSNFSPFKMVSDSPFFVTYFFAGLFFLLVISEKKKVVLTENIVTIFYSCGGHT